MPGLSGLTKNKPEGSVVYKSYAAKPDNPSSMARTNTVGTDILEQRTNSQKTLGWKTVLVCQFYSK